MPLTNWIKLSGPQQERFDAALLRLFDLEDLERLLTYRLNSSMWNIVGPGPAQQVVYDLVCTAQRQNWIDKLLLAASEARPDNPELEALKSELGLGSVGVPGDWELSYLIGLREQLDPIPLPAAVDGRRHARLEDLFVPLELQVGFGAAREQVSEPSKLLAGRKVLLTGAPGAGKSTVLRRAALATTDDRLSAARTGTARHAEDPDSRPAGPARLPIWIDLLEVVSQAAATAGPLMLAEWLPILGAATSLSPAQVHELLQAGDVTIFFDKLDEVPDAVQRQDLVAGIDRIQRHSGPLGAPNHVIVACRTRAAEGAEWAASFQEVRIRPMGGRTRDAYLAAWCHEIWGPDGEDALRTVLDAVRRDPALAELAASPQIATMLASMPPSSGMPVHRVPLYDHFVTTVLSTDRLRRHGDPATLRTQMVALAHAMQLNGEPGQLSAGAASNTLADAGGAPDLLRDLQLHTGLLTVERRFGVGDLSAVVRFEHRTLQEFLAACWFGDHPDELLPHVHDSAWIETLAMTAGVLASFSADRLRGLLTSVIGAPPSEAASANAEEWIVWAPRMAAASACLTEIAPLDISEEVLRPAREAQDLMLPVLRTLPRTTRIAIADGLGSVRDPRLTPEARWVSVTSGPFIRGSTDDDAWEQESPQAEVTVGDFQLQRWPVTVAEFQLFVAVHGYDTREWWTDEGWAWRGAASVESPASWEHQMSRSNCPVTGVSWWEARAYCAWLTEESSVPAGWRAELPTESQWEKAARGPLSGDLPRRRFPWGDRWDHTTDPANSRPLGLSACPVGLFALDESPYGVWDMAGNVAEHCLDGFAPYPCDPGTDPVCHDYAHGHVVRGGSWLSHPLDLRVSVRFGETHIARDDHTGFRVALTRIEKP